MTGLFSLSSIPLTSMSSASLSNLKNHWQQPAVYQLTQLQILNYTQLLKFVFKFLNSSKSYVNLYLTPDMFSSCSPIILNSNKSHIKTFTDLSHPSTNQMSFLCLVAANETSFLFHNNVFQFDISFICSFFSMQPFHFRNMEFLVYTSLYSWLSLYLNLEFWTEWIYNIVLWSNIPNCVLIISSRWKLMMIGV